MKNPLRNLWPNVETSTEALRLVRHGSIALVVGGVLNGGLTALLFTTPGVYLFPHVVDVLTSFALAYGMLRRSRICSVFALFHWLYPFLTMSFDGPAWGAFGALHVILLFIVLRGLRGVMYYHRAGPAKWKNPGWKGALKTLAAILLVLGGAFAVQMLSGTAGRVDAAAELAGLVRVLKDDCRDAHIRLAKALKERDATAVELSRVLGFWHAVQDVEKSWRKEHIRIEERIEADRGERSDAELVRLKLINKSFLDWRLCVLYGNLWPEALRTKIIPPSILPEVIHPDYKVPFTAEVGQRYINALELGRIRPFAAELEIDLLPSAIPVEPADIR